VKDNSKVIKLSEDQIKINKYTLLYDYDSQEEEIEKKSGKKNKKLNFFASVQTIKVMRKNNVYKK
jgi:hypothetical protein